MIKDEVRETELDWKRAVRAGLTLDEIKMEEQIMQGFIPLQDNELDDKMPNKEAQYTHQNPKPNFFSAANLKNILNSRYRSNQGSAQREQEFSNLTMKSRTNVRTSASMGTQARVGNI